MNGRNPASPLSRKNAGWPPAFLVGLVLCVLLVAGISGCSKAGGPATGGGTTPPVATQDETAGALDAAKVLAAAIESGDEDAYASAWDNASVVGDLYEDFIAEVMVSSPGFQRLAANNGRGNDPEALLRETMPKEKFVTITNFNTAEWAAERLYMGEATVTGDANIASVKAKTASNMEIVLVMESQSGTWKVTKIGGPFREFFIDNMGKGFESVMPK